MNIRGLRVLLSLQCFSILGLCLGVKSTEIQDFTQRVFSILFGLTTNELGFLCTEKLATPKAELVFPIPNCCEPEITSEHACQQDDFTSVRFS